MQNTINIAYIFVVSVNSMGTPFRPFAKGPGNGLNLPSSSDSSSCHYNANCTHRYYIIA